MIEWNENEQIIVFLKWNNQYQWYISDKELWFLDYEKRIEAYGKLGYEISNYVDIRRKDLLNLNSNNIELFLKRITNECVTTNELRQSLLEYKDVDPNDWSYKYKPALYIDFDNKKLYSMYGESESYEDYVPDGWEGEFFDFLEYIPFEFQYWIKDGSINLLRGE